ncbi:MAG: hypothetical protein RMK49_02115 [Abditibacteriales bacterium]|nr:hypothetical protein [Abditibacteriales bacterium]
MPNGQTSQTGMTWLMFALMTVFSWGVYGVLLHAGQTGMGDPANGRYKAFLFVGIAYFLTAVLAPLTILLTAKNMSWQMPPKAMWLSLLAGIAGAVGAFCVLLAFGAKGTPAVVMSIVFAGAPIVNAIISMLVHPPEGGLSALKPPFLLGILLAALGGFLVTKYRPEPAKQHIPPAPPMNPAAVKQANKPLSR